MCSWCLMQYLVQRRHSVPEWSQIQPAIGRGWDKIAPDLYRLCDLCSWVMQESVEEDFQTKGYRPNEMWAVEKRLDNRRFGWAPGGLDTCRVKWGAVRSLWLEACSAELFLSQLGGSCLWRCYAAWSLFRLRIEIFLRHQSPFMKSLCSHYPGSLIPHPPTPCHYYMRKKSGELTWVQPYFNLTTAPPPADALYSQ